VEIRSVQHNLNYVPEHNLKIISVNSKKKRNKCASLVSFQKIDQMKRGNVTRHFPIKKIAANLSTFNKMLKRTAGIKD
jgi:hypothetical protein